MATNWDTEEKPGTGLDYSNSGTLYNATELPDGTPLTYNSVGTATSWTEESKP